MACAVRQQIQQVSDAKTIAADAGPSVAFPASIVIRSKRSTRGHAWSERCATQALLICGSWGVQRHHFRTDQRATTNGRHGKQKAEADKRNRRKDHGRATHVLRID